MKQTLNREDIMPLQKSPHSNNWIWIPDPVYDAVVHAIETRLISDFQPISDYVADKLGMEFTDESRDEIYDAISAYNDRHNTEY
jgi:hypothetical protein